MIPILTVDPVYVPDYESFFSGRAKELIGWSKGENNRVRSRKIYKAACRMEYHYRNSQTGNTDPSVHRWSGGCYTFAEPYWIISGPPSPPRARSLT